MTDVQVLPPKLWELTDMPPRLLDKFAAQALDQSDVSLLHTLVVARFVHPGLYHKSAYQLTDLCSTLQSLANDTTNDRHFLAYFGGDVLRALDDEAPLPLELAQLLVTYDHNPNADLLSTEFTDPPDPVISPAARDFLLNHSAAWAIGCARSAFTNAQFDRLLLWYPDLKPNEVHEFEAAIRLHTDSPYRLDLTLARLPTAWVFPVTPNFVAFDSADGATITRIIPHLDTTALINLVAPPVKYYPHRLSPAQIALALAAANDDLVPGVLRNARNNYLPRWYVARLLLRLPTAVHVALRDDSNYLTVPGRLRPVSPTLTAQALLERCSPAVLSLLENPSASLADALQAAKVLTTTP